MTNYVMNIEKVKLGRGRPPYAWMGTIKKTGLQLEMTDARSGRKKTRKANLKGKETMFIRYLCQTSSM